MADRWRPVIAVHSDQATAVADMSISAQGEYVRAEDYYRLLRRNADLERDLNAALDKLQGSVF